LLILIPVRSTAAMIRLRAAASSSSPGRNDRGNLIQISVLNRLATQFPAPEDISHLLIVKLRSARLAQCLKRCRGGRLEFA